MRLVLDVKESFGDLLFLGYSEKKKYDKATGKKTDEVESFVCRVASSEQQGQIEIAVPSTVHVEDIKFSQKVDFRNVVIAPYSRTSEGSSFAEVILRCTADTIIDASKPVGAGTAAGVKNTPEDKK